MLDPSGFTMVELLIGLVLAMFLTVAMLLSYTFLVRSLIRSANQQQLEAQSRRALQMLSQDVLMATDVPSSSVSHVILRLPNGSSGTSFFDVAYAYNANAGDYQVTLLMTDGTTTVTLPYTTKAGTLTRIYAYYSSGNPKLKLLTLLGDPPDSIVAQTRVSNFSFNYLDKQGSLVDASYPLRIKQIEVSGFTVICGNLLTGTQSSYTGASARWVLRSKHLGPY